MSFSSILFEADDDGLAPIAIHRPDKMNAPTHRVAAGLDEAFTRLESDRRIRGLMVTGSGEKAFVAGADIGEMSVPIPAEAEVFSLNGQRVPRRIETMGKPSVAAINGFALGGGLGLAMACTLRVATEDCREGPRAFTGKRKPEFLGK